MGDRINDVKITIMKKMRVDDIHKEYAKAGIPVVCAKGEEGQSYIAEKGERPENFCPGAWDGLKGKVTMLATGENSPYVRHEGIAIHCCNDGLHPVIFKLERV